MHSILIGMVFQKASSGCYTGEPVTHQWIVTQVIGEKIVATRIGIGDELEFRADELEFQFAIVKSESRQDYASFYPSRELIPIQGTDLYLLKPTSETNLFDSWLQHQRELWELLREMKWMS